VESLIDSWDGFLLDSYGVLVNGSGAMPGAADFLRRLRAAKKPFWVVTNDCSRLPETIAARYAQFGLEIEAEQVLTSGLLVADYLRALPMKTPRALVLGTRDSEEYLRRAGATVLPAAFDGDYDVIAVCDDAGFPFVDTIDMALTALFKLCEANRPPALLLPNPDLIYPHGVDRWGFTAGAIALLLESALLRRFPELLLRFTHLGKPEPGLFQRARKMAGTGRLVMIGDQLETDIRGARTAGIDAVLLLTGVSRWQDAAAVEPFGPTHLLSSL
jgi:HAD superfamily hydrolase (TIGR01450 family)